MSRLPAYHLTVRRRADGSPSWMVHWRHRRPDGTTKQVAKAVGPAWLVPAGDGWAPNRARPRKGELTENAATVRASEIVAQVEDELAIADARPPATGPGSTPTVREVAAAFIEQRRAAGSKPAYIRDLEHTFAEPGAQAKKRGRAHQGRVLAAIGSKRADRVTTADIDRILDAIADEGRAPRTVNKTRQTLHALFEWAGAPKTFGITPNPVTHAERRREPSAKPLDYYTVEEVEALARALAEGKHRTPRNKRMAAGETKRIVETVTPEEQAARRAEDEQDGEAVRIAFYTGLRLAELCAGRLRHIDWQARKLRVERNVSAGVEVDAPKGGTWREVPLADPAMGALARVTQRPHFTGPNDYILAGRTGERLSTGALSKRVGAAMTAIGLRKLRFHDLRHGFGSTLVAAGVDLVTVKNALGHAKLATTERYLHARDATETAATFTAAFSHTPTGPSHPHEPPPPEKPPHAPRDTPAAPDDRDHPAAGSGAAVERTTP